MQSTQNLQEQPQKQQEFTSQELDAKAQELLEKKETEAQIRNTNTFWANFIGIIAIIWSLFQIYYTSFGTLDVIRLRVWHILFLVTLAFLMYPPRFIPQFLRKKSRIDKTKPSIIDFLLIGLTYVVFGYLLLYNDEVAMRGGWFTDTDKYIAAMSIIITFIIGIRVVPNLAFLAAIFILYLFLGSYIPGAFGHTGFSWERVSQHMFWGTQGLLGVAIGVSATYIFLFILFGAFLKYSGFSSFINDIALSLVGQSVGGPAKVSVFASALMGMINGSALANVATTGAITIPLMKRTGYKAEFAGAVEAVASTGGQFAPPIMGAVGFIMAELLGVKYTTVMLAACIPAFLYYLALIMAVHFEAKRLGLKGLSRENIPNTLKVLKERGHLLIPLILLIALLFMGYTPLYAACIAIFATICASWLRKETRMSLRTILHAMDEGARSAVGVGAACLVIGIIIGTVSLSALGLTFAQEVLRYVGEGQIYLAGFLVMIMSVILGMGVPGVAAYVIVAAVAVPVLVKVGVIPLAAHMFCLFYACLSNITPPVAMSSFVAAGIANADQTKTALVSVRLGLTGFILPFFFLDNPLLLYNPEHAILPSMWALCTASLGVVSLAAGLEGWLAQKCTLPMRLMLITTGLLAIHPNFYSDFIGIALFTLVFIWNKTSIKKGTLHFDV